MINLAISYTIHSLTRLRDSELGLLAVLPNAQFGMELGVWEPEYCIQGPHPSALPLCDRYYLDAVNVVLVILYCTGVSLENDF